MAGLDYSPLKHDLGLVTTTYTSGIGLMLVRDKDGRLLHKGQPSWQEFDDPILAAQYFTGSPDASYRPPDREIRIGQNSFRAGFGLKYFDQNEPERYYSSKNCDGRFRGKMIAGPLGATVTKPSSPSAPSITDGGLEIWTGNDLDNWTESGDAGLTPNDTIENEGTYCAYMGGTAEIAYIYQDVDSTNDYAGMEVIFTAYGYSATAGDYYRIGINDGVDTTYSDYLVGDSGWHQLTATRTLSVAADKVRLICQKATTNVAVGYFDGAMTCTVTASTVGVGATYADFNDLHYKSFGAVLASQHSGGAAYTYVAEMPASITDMKVFRADDGTSRLHIALGDSTDMAYMTAAEVFVSSPSNEQAYFLHAVGATLYGIKQAGGNKLRSTTTVDTWGDECLVGHSYDNQTDVLSDAANTVIVCKEDMPYYITSAPSALPYLPEAITMKASTSGKNSHLAFGKVYFQFGDQTLYEFDGAAGSATAYKTNISPATFMSDLSDFSGKIMAIADDGTYLYVVISNDPTIEILAGQWETLGGTTDWRWHPIAQLTLAGCETAVVSSHVKKRLWITSTTAANNIYYFPCTTKYGDIASDTNYLYQTDGEFITPWHHIELRGDNKAYYKITLTLGHSNDTNIYFEAHYKKWGDASFTSIGDFKGTATVRTASIALPADGSTVEPVSTFIQFKFVAKLDSPYGTSPILEDYDCRGAWRPTRRNLIACAIECDEDMVLQGAVRDKGRITDIKAAIAEAAAATWPVTVYTPDGDTITVNLLQPVRSYIKSIEKVSDQKTKITRIYEFLFQKVTVHS